MAVGVGILFVGYTLTWWGWRRLQGSVDLLDLIVPGRNPGVKPLSGGVGGVGAAGATAGTAAG